MTSAVRMTGQVEERGRRVPAEVLELLKIEVHPPDSWRSCLYFVEEKTGRGRCSAVAARYGRTKHAPSHRDTTPTPSTTPTKNHRRPDRSSGNNAAKESAAAHP